jgi:site-specific DNA recombinase
MSTTLATKRAVGYLRVSSTGQTGERHSSLDTQRACFEEHCQRFDLLPVSTFVDVVSGKRDDRKEYRRMVDYVTQGGADVIIVQFLDRFGRNPREILQRFWELKDFGVSIVATDEDIQEELLLLIKAGIAGAESRRTSERVRANMGRAVQKGVQAARPPFGLRPVREIINGHVDTRWELDPIEAPIVREMYHLAVEENLGYKAIADRLTQQGYMGRGGRPFATYTIQRVLSNEALMGDLVYGKRPKKGNPQQELARVPGFFPAILSPEEWQRLQERLSIRRESSRGKTHSSEYLLSGILRCGNCGGPMAGRRSAAYKGKHYRNYWCSRAMKSRALCSTYNGHSAVKVEKAVLEYLGQFSDPEVVAQHLATARGKDLEEREQELQGVLKALSELEHQFLQHLDLLKRGVISEPEFVRANEAARSQVGALESRRDELSTWLAEQRGRVAAAEGLPQAIRSFLEDFQELDVRRQKAQLQTILKACYVYRDDRLELEFRG